MAIARAVVNRPSPFRLQLILEDLTGPLRNSSGPFDPRKHIAIYNGGRQIGVDSYSWDPNRNRYLVFLQEALDFDIPIQVIHHVPTPPFAEDLSNPTLLLFEPGKDPDLFDEVGL